MRIIFKKVSHERETRICEMTMIYGGSNLIREEDNRGKVSIHEMANRSMIIITNERILSRIIS